MAITQQMARLILLEHKHKPITGEVLLLGRQTVFMTPKEVIRLLQETNIPLRKNATIELDSETQGHKNTYISDRSFFSLFTDAKIYTCDVSDYEGAEFIFDLSQNIPDNLCDKFDFIYNGSVLDNVFDPASCIKNISKMLKKTGVVFHYEGLKHQGMTYLKFTPEWFFDYYALNRFSDAQVYLLIYDDYFSDYWAIEWDAFVKTSTGEPSPAIRMTGEAMVVTIAQNSETATQLLTPIQNTYREDHSLYLTAAQQYQQSSRRADIRNELNARMPRDLTPDVSLKPTLFKRVLNKILPNSPPPSKIALPFDNPTLGHSAIGVLKSEKLD